MEEEILKLNRQLKQLNENISLLVSEKNKISGKIKDLEQELTEISEAEDGAYIILMAKAGGDLGNLLGGEIVVFEGVVYVIYTDGLTEVMKNQNKVQKMFWSGIYGKKTS